MDHSPTPPDPKSSKKVADIETENKQLKPEPVAASSYGSALSSAEYLLIERKGFELLKEQVLDGLDARAIVMRHRDSQAIICAIQANDPNLRFHNRVVTLPENNTGVFHKLEHALLSGSPKITVAEPFEEMHQSLLQIDTNAFTADDHTEYYAVSQDPESLKIMGSVMFDGMARGTLSKDTYFREHGCLRPDPHRPGELVHAGIVHDEMKGYYSGANWWIHKGRNAALSPNTPYAFDAGGDPQEMPELSYEQFLDTYRRFYGTANMTGALYGSLGLEEQLDFWNEQIGNSGHRGARLLLPEPAQVPVKESTGVRAETVKYPLEADEPEALSNGFGLDIAWKFPLVLDHQESLEMSILCRLLSTTDYSPITQAHRAAELSSSHTGTYFYELGKESVFLFNFMQSKKDEVPDLRELVHSTLERIARDGFAPETIEAELRKAEYSFRRFLSRTDRGEQIVGQILKGVTYADDLNKIDIDGENYLSRLEQLKIRLAAGQPVFQDLIRKYLLSESERIEITYQPDPDLLQKWQTAQDELIARQATALGPDAFRLASEQAQRLKELEDKKCNIEAVASFPRANVPERYKQALHIETELFHIAGVPLYKSFVDTHGLHRVDLVFSLDGVSREELPLVEIMKSYLLRRGPQGSAPGAYQAELAANSGGISASIANFSDHKAADPLGQKGQDVLQIRMEATDQDFSAAIQLAVAPFARPDFNDKALFESLVRRGLTGIKTSKGGPNTLRSLIMSRMDQQSSTNGLRHFELSAEAMEKHLESFLERAQTDWPALSNQMQELATRIFKRGNMNISATMLASDFALHQPALEQALEKIPAGSVAVLEEALVPQNASVNLEFPLANNYVGERFQLQTDSGERFTEHGKMLVVQSLLARYLNQEVRSKGNAYGAFMSYSPHSSQVSFLSWQDPNINRTFEAFQRSSAFLRESVTEDLLERAKVATMNSLNQPLTPQDLGFVGFRRIMHNTPIEDLNKLRAEVMRMSLQDVAQMADILQQSRSPGTVRVVAASPAALKNAGLKVD